MNLSNGRLDKRDAGERAEKAEATRSYNTQSKETTMFKRITLAALASTAILSLAAISPASAQHHPGAGGMHLTGGFHPGGSIPAVSTPAAFIPVGSILVASTPAGSIRTTRTGAGIGVTTHTVTVRSSSNRAIRRATWLPPTPLRRLPQSRRAPRIALRNSIRKTAASCSPISAQMKAQWHLLALTAEMARPKGGNVSVRFQQIGCSARQGLRTRQASLASAPFRCSALAAYCVGAGGGT